MFDFLRKATITGLLVGVLFSLILGSIYYAFYLTVCVVLSGLAFVFIIKKVNLGVYALQSGTHLHKMSITLFYILAALMIGFIIDQVLTAVAITMAPGLRQAISYGAIPAGCAQALNYIGKQVAEPTHSAPHS